MNHNIDEEGMEEYRQQLLSGGKLFITAEPLDKRFETLVWAVDLKYLYSGKVLATGQAFVGDIESKLPGGATPDDIIDGTISAISAMSGGVGGALVTISLANLDTSIVN